jgi:hypothetical protein
MRKRRWFIAGGLVVVVGVALLVWWFDLIPLAEVEDGDYPMRPVSALTESGRLELPQNLASGQGVWWKTAPDQEVGGLAAENTSWRTLPDKDVKVYPKLRSGRPLYGAVEFGRSPVEPSEGMRFCFVLDESAGTGTGYDRLYFDANRDLDLTNDAVLEPIEVPPAPSKLLHLWGECALFDPLSIAFDFGPEDGTRPVEILPRLTCGKVVALYFVPTEARKGKIQIGRRRYYAVLAQPERITGRYDRPSASLYLTTAGGRETWHDWGGADEICSFRLVDGRFYTISATPTGDRLMVRRYRGDLGVLRIDPGKRQIADVSLRGSLRSETGIVPVGQPSTQLQGLDPVVDCEVPVGDYHPEALNIRYGSLRIFLSDNYHLDGKRRGAMNLQAGTIKSPVYGIKIRKDRPYLFDFSNKPEVMFASPAKDQTFKPGDEVTVHAVLIDPVLNTMIRGLDDTSRKKPPPVDAAGFPRPGLEGDLSLPPVVTIADSSGKNVSEGKMPFG